jgi:hypothetical protein
MPIENLQAIYEKADDYDRRLGLESFWHYNRLMQTIGAKYGFTGRTAAGVFAALSPNNDYYGNVRDCERMLRAAAAADAIDSFPVSTYGPNKRKAWDIAHGTDPLKLIVALKTRNFFINIADPTDREAVTIDGHMRNVWMGKRVNLVGANVKRSDYLACAQDVRDLAAKNGLVAWQMQGVIWYCWRKIHGIRTSPQLTLWDPAYLAARIFVPCS